MADAHRSRSPLIIRVGVLLLQWPPVNKPSSAAAAAVAVAPRFSVAGGGESELWQVMSG